MTAQPLAALEVANETRLAGAAFRRELRAMSHDDALAAVARVLGHARGPLGSQSVETLVRAVPGFGRERVGALLEAARVRVGARVRDLSAEQQRALIAAMTGPIAHGPRQRRPPTAKRPAPKRLPAAPLIGWIDAHYRSPEAAAKALGISARSLRHMERARQVQTRTVEDLLTRAPICMHDLYPPADYPELYR